MKKTDIRHYDAEKVIEEAEMRGSKVGVCLIKTANRIFSPTAHPVKAESLPRFIGFAIFMLRTYGASVRLMTYSPQEGWQNYKEFYKNGCNC